MDIRASLKKDIAQVQNLIDEAWALTGQLISIKQNRSGLPMIMCSRGHVPSAYEIEKSEDSTCPEPNCGGALVERSRKDLIGPVYPLDPMTQTWNEYDPQGAARRRAQLSEAEAKGIPPGDDEQPDDGEDARLGLPGAPRPRQDESDPELDREPGFESGRVDGKKIPRRPSRAGAGKLDNVPLYQRRKRKAPRIL